MANHFSTIGLPVKTPENLPALAKRVADSTERFSTDNGDYCRWCSASGAEVWLQNDDGGILIGIHPHFAGNTQQRVSLVERFTRPGATQLDGAYRAWIDPPDHDLDYGYYPLVFDAPDFQLHRGVAIPSVARVQIAAFAHNVEVFDSQEAYKAAESGSLWSSKSFIPSGLLAVRDTPDKPPQAHAIIRGHILETEMRTTELASTAFHWALVQTYHITMDVVIDPELLNTPLRVNGVLAGSFWLSGRIVN